MHIFSWICDCCSRCIKMILVNRQIQVVDKTVTLGKIILYHLFIDTAVYGYEAISIENYCSWIGKWIIFRVLLEKNSQIKLADTGWQLFEWIQVLSMELVTHIWRWYTHTQYKHLTFEDIDGYFSDNCCRQIGQFWHFVIVLSYPSIVFHLKQVYHTSTSMTDRRHCFECVGWVYKIECRSKSNESFDKEIAMKGWTSRNSNSNSNNNQRSH